MNVERLTKCGYQFSLLNVLQGLTRYTEIDEILNQLAAYEDTGLEPEEIKQMCALARLNSNIFDNDFGNHIAELIVAEQDGRLLVLPCKVGDTFYTIEQQWTLCHLDNYRDEYSCQGCEEEKCDSKKVPEIVAHKCSTVSQLAAYIGKTVFLTRPEAEAALASAKQVEASAVASEVHKPGGEQE